MKFSGKKQGLRLAGICVCMAATSTAFAAEAPKPSELNNSLAIVLLIVAVALLLAIGMLGYVLIGTADFYVERFKEKAKATATVAKTVLVAGLSLFATTSFAQTEAAPQAVNSTIGGLSPSSFYGLVGIIGLEVIILLAMLLFLKQLIAREKTAVVVEAAEAKEPLYKVWWKKMNNWRPAHEEAKLTLDHDYDGIKELDNNLPPWWLYGFYACVIFAFIYIYRYHIAHTAPLSHQEYEMAMAQAEIEKQEYLKNAANNVDENTVELITEAGTLAEGKKIFAMSCAPCHGADGQGTVGPNLTDDYWLHKGGVKDVFKTIKYGVPEKGMKAWKDDFSPVQIAAVTSYIKSIHGTNPANAKEPQGDLFTEEAPATDSTKAVADVIAQK